MSADGKDSYQALPGYDKLKWTDHLKIAMQPDLDQTDNVTGATVNPKKEYMKQLIKQRTDEESAAR